MKPGSGLFQYLLRGLIRSAAQHKHFFPGRSKSVHSSEKSVEGNFEITKNPIGVLSRSAPPPTRLTLKLRLVGDSYSEEKEEGGAFLCLLARGPKPSLLFCLPPPPTALFLPPTHSFLLLFLLLRFRVEMALRGKEQGGSPSSSFCVRRGDSLANGSHTSLQRRRGEERGGKG